MLFLFTIGIFDFSLPFLTLFFYHFSINSFSSSCLKIQYEIIWQKKKEDKRIDERIKWDEIIFPGIRNEIDDERINDKFYRAFERKMNFPFYAPKEDNEIEEEDERWGVIM